jgi:DNA-binding response OmpR family regulator
MSEAAPRILIVEDEAHLANGLRFNLEAEGYVAKIAETGEAALQEASEFDLLILDVMLPGIDGFQVVSKLREHGSFLPVLMLTARGRPDDIVQGFSAGADDYLPKPFDLAILLARVNGLLRRSSWQRQVAGDAGDAGDADDAVTIGDRVIDFKAMEIRHRERKYLLTLMETNLLRFLLNHSGEAVSRKRLLEEVWGVREDTDTRAIDNFIVRLRKYLEDEPTQPRHLLTVRGVGYRFDV